ncbi:MAG: UvrB/UvrC motif-containing protein [Faecalibacterium sp.]|nr:UvrB/UvrC motif-containing protein [Ruminococcus sp.]MCM1392201.1 UvrB/UvrC motif-containing protein [Ruminococcus sp.]MCM1485389.1 UvrB/UvrC motif-containing protein [Faecalibacterium sp.]
MLCQNCSKREATTHIKRVVNGEATETHLCHECAQSLGYNGLFNNFSLSIPNIFSSFFGDSSFALTGARTERCEKCGCSFDDIVRTGMVGCADCYEKFFDKLLPSIQRIHGKSKHAGKIPDIQTEKKVIKEKTTEEKIAELEVQMQKAIESQNFEQAAIIRDQIKELKGVN